MGGECGSAVKNLPAMQEKWVQSLGREDLLEKEMATTPGFLPGNPMDRGAWRTTVHGVTRVRHDWAQHSSPVKPSFSAEFMINASI